MTRDMTHDHLTESDLVKENERLRNALKEVVKTGWPWKPDGDVKEIALVGGTAYCLAMIVAGDLVGKPI